jgi:hypothetical protein
MADITHQVKDEQNDEHKTQAATSSGCASIGVSATAEEKQQDNNDNDE